jgi:hypothetical protein
MSSTALNDGELHSFLTSLGYRQHKGSWDFRIVFDFLAVGLDFRPPAILRRVNAAIVNAPLLPPSAAPSPESGYCNTQS